jgi:hypothetical protein
MMAMRNAMLNAECRNCEYENELAGAVRIAQL